MTDTLSSVVEDNLADLKSARSGLKSQMDALLETAKRSGSSSLSADQTTKFDALHAQILDADGQIAAAELRLTSQRQAEERSNAAAALRVATGNVGLQRGYHVSGGETYFRGNESPSFFRDLLNAQRGDYAAAKRLQRNNTEVAFESRALGNSGAAGGSGGEFAPPGWFVEDFVRLARPGRVTLDLFHKEVLPKGISTVNLPRVATGTTDAVQTTQNTGLSQTDMTTGSVSAGITTIGGKQVVSLQLINQSSVPFDQVVLTDLAADYAKQIGIQAISGSGASGQLRGYLTPASTNVVTWTQASPTVAGFYGQLAKLQSQIYATRFMAPDTVVMHPRRWAWFASGVDNQNRPLVVPSTGGQGSYNTMASSMGSVEAGYVGTVLGMNVYTDPNIPTNLGAGTNQDIVLMFPREDIWFWESELQAEAFQATYADSAGVLLRVLAFSSLIPDRYLASLGQITGTGLTPPTFAS